MDIFFNITDLLAFEEPTDSNGIRQHAKKLCDHNNVCGCTAQVASDESHCAKCKKGDC